MKIKLRERINISKVRKTSKRCIYCGGVMVRGQHHISMGDYLKSNHINIWLHISCLDGFCKQLRSGEVARQLVFADEFNGESFI